MRCFLILLSLILLGDMLKADSSSSRIAAIVNKDVISKADLMNRLRFAAMSSGLEPTPQNLDRIKDQMLRVMIDEQLQLQIGKKFNFEIKEQHIQDAIKDIEESNSMPEGTIAKMMQENNIPFKILKDQIKAQLTWLIYIREKYPLKTLEDQVKKKNQPDYTPSLQIADWEVDQELKLQKEKETKTQYHLAEIVLPFERPEQEESVKNDLNHLIEELEKGAHFSALAQQFSGSATSAQGGDMGWLTEDQLESEIKEYVLHMQPGQLSTPIRTSQRYIIIAFLEKKLPGLEGQSLVTMQQVLLPFPANVTTEAQAQPIVMKAADISRSAKSCPDLERIAKEKFPSASSRMLRDTPLASLPEPLQQVISPLALNQTTEPLLTEDGALLVMVCERKSQKKEELTKEDAMNLIASRKYALLARRELRDLRRHAFIDVRM